MTPVGSVGMDLSSIRRDSTGIDPKLNGIATFILENGSRITGDFKGGYLNGVGKLTYEDGSYYEGDFRNNVCDGRGCFYYATPKNSYIRDGLWKDGKIWIGDIVVQGRIVQRYIDGKPASAPPCAIL